MNEPNDLDLAKARLNAAAQACLENRPRAADAADEAKAELDALQHPQRAHLCAADNCCVITLDLYCWKHRRLAVQPFEGQPQTLSTFRGKA